MAELWFQRRDPRTGEVVRGVLPLTDGLSIGERYVELTRLARALATDPPRKELAVAVICDGCGRSVALRGAQTPPGWTTARGRDYCPGCPP